MVANNVSAFFHGHDHQFVHEEIDGIVYQLVPSPGMVGTGFNLYTTSPYVQTGGNLPSPGHLRVTVEPDETEVEYVRSAISGDTGVTNGAVEYSYSFLPVSYLYGDYGPTDCDVDGSDLAEWIANGAPEGRIITAFAANFGMTVCP